MTDIKKLTESLHKKYVNLVEDYSYEEDRTGYISPAGYGDFYLTFNGERIGIIGDDASIELYEPEKYDSIERDKILDIINKDFEDAFFTDENDIYESASFTGHKKLTEAAQHTNYIIKLLNVVNDYIEKRMHDVDSIVADESQSLQVGDETYTMRVNFVPVYTLSNPKTGDIYRFTTQKGVEYKSNNDVVYDIINIIKEDM